jgi:hypothetical protein
MFMNEDVFGDIEALDAALDKEFGELANSQVEENEEQETENEEVVDTSEGEATQEPTAEEPAETVENSVEQSSEETEKVNKKEHAFANLRAENGNLKRERDAYKSDSDFLKSLAQSYGYDDTAKFQEALKLSRYQKEAESKGYDYDLYRRTMEQEERISQLEKEKVERENEVKLERFKNALDSAISKYGVSEDDIFSRLEDAGVSVEEILSISNPNLLIKGVLSDKIQAVAKQNQISEIQNMRGLVEDKNEPNAQSNKVTIESLLKSDLAEYKKNNYFD